MKVRLYLSIQGRTETNWKPISSTFQSPSSSVLLCISFCNVPTDSWVSRTDCWWRDIDVLFVWHISHMQKSGFEYNEMGSSQSHEVFDLLGSTWSVVGYKPGSVNSGDDPQEEGSRSYRRRQESVRTVSVGLCSYYYATQSWCHRSDEDCRKEGRSYSGWNVENDRHVTQTDSQEPHSGEGGDASDALWL